MAHALILGMTESGKTTLARNLAAAYKRAGFSVLVLDPLRDPRWSADFITDDQEEFMRVFWDSRRCMCFLDEGGESVGRYNTAMQKTATRGRHWGHSCHFIAQRATQLAPIVRDQCTHIFLFCSSAKDGALLADEWNKPELAECSGFAQGEYVHAVKFGHTTHNTGGKANESDSDADRGGSVRRGLGAAGTGSGKAEEGKTEGSGTGNATGTSSGSGDGD